MNKDDVVKQINQLLLDEYEVEEENITPQADIFKTLDIDSLDVVDLVVDLEKQFSIKLKTSEMTEVTNLQLLYDYIYGKIDVCPYSLIRLRA